LFEGLDFNGIGITGSCIACCLPKFNPLHLIFNDFNSFVNEYYNNADLDIISNLSDFEFVDKANHIIDILKININNKLEKTDFEIKYDFIKTIYICINDEYIKDNFNCSKDEINFNNLEVKEHFYNKYTKSKTELYNENINKYSYDKYKNIYNNISIDKIILPTGIQLTPTVSCDWLPVSFFEIPKDLAKDYLTFDMLKDNTNCKLYIYDGEEKNEINN
jgi:hypothetical protein